MDLPATLLVSRLLCGARVSMKRLLLVVGGVAGLVIGAKLAIENVAGIALEPLVTAWLTQAGTGTAVTVVALLASDLFLPIPSSLVMVLSGAAFGVLWGSVLSLVGSIGGEWCGFELVRRYGRRASRSIASDRELRRLDQVFERYGAAAVIVTRALPVVMETMSVVAGLSGMSRATFLTASLIGTAPIAVVYAYAGAVSRQVGSVVPAIVILIAVAGAAYVWYRARIPQAPPDPVTTAAAAAAEDL